MDAAAVAHHRGLQAVMNAAPIVSIATAKERAWERLRFAIFNVTGRVVRDRRKMRLRLAASREWIRQLTQLFEAFPLLTHATG